MAEIELEALAREQMHRNGISRKRVHQKNVKVLDWLALERNAGIPRNNFDLRPRIAQEVKLSASYLNNRGINFIERKAIACLSVSRKRSGSQADDARVNAAVLVGISERERGARLGSVVSGGFGPPGAFQYFNAMHNRSINKLSDRRLIDGRGGLLHSQEPIKVPHFFRFLIFRRREVGQE